MSLFFLCFGYTSICLTLRYGSLLWNGQTLYKGIALYSTKKRWGGMPIFVSYFHWLQKKQAFPDEMKQNRIEQC